MERQAFDPTRFRIMGREDSVEVSEARFAEYLESSGFEPHASREGEWQSSECHICGDGRAGRVMASEKGVVNCYGCARGWNAFWWVADREGIGLLEAKMLIGEVPLLEEVEVAPPPAPGELELRELRLPAHWGVDHLPAPWMHAALQAVVNRGFSLDFLRSKLIGFGTGGVWSMRVVLPVWFKGVHVWAQAWDWQRRSDVKYMSPAKEKGIVGRKELVYQWDLYRYHPGPVVVGEGVFNTWAVEQVGYPGVATFGKGVSETQKALLMGMASESIIVAFDPDAHEQAAKLATEFMSLGKRAFVLDWPDPKSDLNDLPMDVRREVLASAREVSWWDL